MLRPIENRYSAEVRLTLALGEQSIPLAQISPDWIVLRDPIELEPCCGEVVATVDGKERRWPVELTEGAQQTDTKVAIRDVVQENV